jgi:uncharacterized NAD(P)/FAD-binding protein YdhS
MRIAVVGLGTAGACMLDSLSQALRSHPDISLTLYDPAPEPWRGRVFAPDSEYILANAPVEAMSVRQGDTAHAKRWLVRQGDLDPGSAEEVFLPRQRYGQYLLQHAEGLVHDLRGRGWTVEFVQESATSLVPVGSSRYVVGAGSRRDEFNYVILCAGGSVLGNPFRLDGCDGYVADPYPTRERLDGLRSDAAVGVLGSGLTAVDVAVALRERGHDGPIRMYSRSGVLPLVRRPGPPWTAKHLTSEQLVDLACSTGSYPLVDVERLVNREVQAWGGRTRGLFPAAPGPANQAAWLRRQLERPHDAADLETFIFQKSIPLVWQDIWYSLTPEDQRRILASPATLRSIISRCCPMPQVNARKILAMLDSGQLTVRGGVTSVMPRRKAFDVQLATAREHVDYVVNAITPAVYGVHPKVEPLVDSAIAHGLARRHHAGGLQVLARTSAVVGRDGPGALYALGDLTRGAFFFTFGLPVLVSRSADIAKAIHDDLHEKAQALPRRSALAVGA